MMKAQSVNQRIVLSSRPVGAPPPENFRFEEYTVPVITDGQVRLRSLFLSLVLYTHHMKQWSPK